MTTPQPLEAILSPSRQCAKHSPGVEVLKRSNTYGYQGARAVSAGPAGSCPALFHYKGYYFKTQQHA